MAYLLIRCGGIPNRERTAPGRVRWRSDAPAMGNMGLPRAAWNLYWQKPEKHYNNNRKATGKRVSRLIVSQRKWLPLLGRVTGVALYCQRYCISEDMKRYCNRHSAITSFRRCADPSTVLCRLSGPQICEHKNYIIFGRLIKVISYFTLCVSH